MKFPFCYSENTTAIPIEIIDSDVKERWWTMFALALLGIIIHPIVYILLFTNIILSIIGNISKKLRHKNKLFMQCTRRRNQFMVLNPKITKKQMVKEKKEFNQKRHVENVNNRFQTRLKNFKRNGRLTEEERLLFEIDYFGFHKNAFYTTNGKLKITDETLVCYSEKGAFRITKSNIISVKRKNYFLFIPTGIQIIVKDKRIYKYNFVVFPKERQDIINKIQSEQVD